MGINLAVAKLAPELTGKLPPWDFDSLAESKKRFKEGGFDLVALEGDQFDMTRIKLGLPGREEDAEHYRMMLRNIQRREVIKICFYIFHSLFKFFSCYVIYYYYPIKYYIY